MRRILAIDLGDQRIGLALSDPTRSIARSHQTIQRTDREADLAAIRAIIAAEDVERIVVGMPLGLSGLPGVQAELTRRWVEALQRTVVVPVEVWDERLTTVQAHRTLESLGVKRRQHRRHIDAVAATLLLQGYLDHQRKDG